MVHGAAAFADPSFFVLRCHFVTHNEWKSAARLTACQAMSAGGSRQNRSTGIFSTGPERPTQTRRVVHKRCVALLATIVHK
jgi:hypothetical protein